jgi:triosephosphate isomerase (TIM)
MRSSCATEVDGVMAGRDDVNGPIRRPLIGTSSKMNLTSSQAADYFDTLRTLLADLDDRELFVLPPFTSIWVARDRLAGSNISWGAQDVHPDDAGAHTGDVSAPMLADLGCTWVEVGHHERRRDHGETDELVRAKVEAAQRWRMRAIVCVGEHQRLPLPDVARRLAEQLAVLARADPDRLVIAYEPAWAIGAGRRPASPAWVRQAHATIREELGRVFGSGGPTAAAIPIIYGGSVGPGGSASLLAQPDVDGLFVGRQALDPSVFSMIAHTPIEARPPSAARRLASSGTH